jgi:FlaG/FlaF family flagellin (archaellin)
VKYVIATVVIIAAVFSLFGIILSFVLGQVYAAMEGVDYEDDAFSEELAQFLNSLNGES